MSKIVLIDDDKQTGLVLGATLRVLGHEILLADSAEQGEALIARSAPDVAFVDLILPGVNGLEFIGELGRQFPNMYLCLATGMADYGLLKRAISAGAWSMMSKPFALAELMEVVQLAGRYGKIRARLAAPSDRRISESVSISNLNELAADNAAICCSRLALASGSDHDTANRVLPVIVIELVRNACQYGDGTCQLFCEVNADNVMLRVTNGGRGFSWLRELARRKTSWDKSKASGLQLISALAANFAFEDDGRTANVTIPKHSLPTADVLVAVAEQL